MDEQRIAADDTGAVNAVSTNSSAASAGGKDDFERSGERSNPAFDSPLGYTLADEPLDSGRPVDYRYLYQLVLERYGREDERGKNLDAKLAVLLTGVVASIGFSFRTTITPQMATVSLLELVPFVFILLGYTTKITQAAPTIESLETEFPFYPVSTLREGVKAMRIANEKNKKINDSKATSFDLAFLSAICATAITLGTQCLFAWVPPSVTAPVPAPSAGLLQPSKDSPHGDKSMKPLTDSARKAGSMSPAFRRALRKQAERRRTKHDIEW